MKQRLIILSDMFGFESFDFLNFYLDVLSDQFDIQVYDSLSLAKIPNDLEEKELHRAYVNGGIERAVSHLLTLEASVNTVIAFSIGGAIAWKAALKGLKISKLIAVSSTRLRHEQEKPLCSVSLIYGENDMYRPDPAWIRNMNVNPLIIPDMGHELYKEKACVNHIISSLKD